MFISLWSWSYKRVKKRKETLIETATAATTTAKIQAAGTNSNDIKVYTS